MTTQTAPVATKNSNTPAPTGTAAPATTKAPQPPTISTIAKSITDAVEHSIHQMVTAGRLVMPKDYAVDNALKSAYLMLQNVENKDHQKAVDVCTRESIANALLDMVVQGLNVGKKQGYFIMFAKQLVFMRSYMGAMAVAEMVNPNIKDWGYACVYEGDVFKYKIENGKKTVILHEQELDNVDKAKIKAAYCIALDKDAKPIRTEISPIDDIHQAWDQSRNNPFDEKGNLKPSSTHGKFASDMAIKTMINKCCKIIINSSSDNALLKDTINKTYDIVDAAVAQAEITEHANIGEVLQIAAETGGRVVDAEFHDDAQEKTEADPVCVCEQFTKEKAKEWDCPVHGRYQGVRFTPPQPQRKPNF